MKKNRLLLLALAGLLGLCGCRAVSLGNLEKETMITIDESETPAETEPAETVITHHRVYHDLEYVSDEEKATWREPLLRLFENELPRFMGEKSLGDSSAETTDPDTPRIERGYYAGLLDIDTDGVPELIIDLGGGSAGNACYNVYDLYTGEELGSMDGGYGDAWCTYLNAENGRLETIGRFTWRLGFSQRSTFVRRAVIVGSEAGNRMLYEYPMMEMTYNIKMVPVELTPEQIEKGISESWEEVCVGVSFYLNDSRTYLDDYLRAMDDFHRTRIRIPETEMKEIIRYDYEDDEIERLVDDLLALDQKFVKPTDGRPQVLPETQPTT